jgi:bifunctional DNA-binding transcriptional regulator/antitoxin component of YhaV-PrlF toxin-antitoxin module
MITMPTIKLHYDGWLALPAGLRQALGLNSGDRLEAELVDGALVLRPVAKTRRSAPGGEAAVSIAADAAEMLPLAADGAPVRRKPGRPRKVNPVAGEQVTAPKKARGRPRSMVPARDTDAVASTRPVLGPPKLLKKSDLEGRTTLPDVAAPAVQPASLIRPNRAAQPVERRPFRNVEIRPLGPGRGHGKWLSGGTRRPSS